MAEKTCFVISPLGDEGTPTRQHADDFLELLVEPALQPYNFNLVRADKISASTEITSDIIEYVQQSDLCLVDLTFHNANVFYECGRRHETGRPTIQLIKKGEKLPFDVAGIRTIQYDLSDPRSTLSSIRDVQRFVEDIDAAISLSGGSPSSGASLTTLAETLARIERQLSAADLQARTSGGGVSRRDLLTMHPAVAFNKALEEADIDAARSLLPRIKKYLGETEYVGALAVLAELADEQSKTDLYEALPTMIPNKQYDELGIALVGLTDFYNTTASSSQGISELADIIYDFTNSNEHPEEERAFALNRLQLLRYRENQYAEALNDAVKVLELAPDNDSYHYNISLVYEALERFPEAADSGLRFLELAQDAKQHYIQHVRDVLGKAGKDKKEIDHILSEFLVS